MRTLGCFLSLAVLCGACADDEIETRTSALRRTVEGELNTIEWSAVDDLPFCVDIGQTPDETVLWSIVRMNGYYAIEQADEFRCVDDADALISLGFDERAFPEGPLEGDGTPLPAATSSPSTR